MPEEVRLFTDEQMRQFISRGYLTLRTELSHDFHDDIYTKISSVFEESGNPGNNLLPRIPELSMVFDDPVVRGAFQSVLGSDNFMHPHRHPHHNPGNNEAQGWHKDSYWGFMKVRHHRPWWAMAFYYPQDVTHENGPSSVIPGSQYSEERHVPEDDPGMQVIGEAGTITIIQYDVWHRAAANMTGDSRFMFKFQFARTRESSRVTWASEEADWSSPAGVEELPSGDATWRHMWHWMRGDRTPAYVGSESISELIEGLGDALERRRLDSSYSLVAVGSDAVSALGDALASDSETVIRHAACALGCIGEAAVPRLVDALKSDSDIVRTHVAAALGEAASGAATAVQWLSGHLTDPSENVRRTVAESLGMICTPESETTPALLRAMEDTDAQVRFNALLSLARIGPGSDEVLPALRHALYDENRYVRAYVPHVLRRMGSSSATDLLLDHLMQTRWCPLTTAASTF